MSKNSIVTGNKKTNDTGSSGTENTADVNGKQFDLCEEKCEHEKLIEYVEKDMPSIDTLYELSELYRVFGDSTRIRILYVLFESEVCVCDIAKVLDMSVSAISHQLRVLKSAGLVKFRRDGKTCFYSLADDHVKIIIAQGIEHITE